MRDPNSLPQEGGWLGRRGGEEPAVPRWGNPISTGQTGAWGLAVNKQGALQPSAAASPSTAAGFLDVLSHPRSPMFRPHCQDHLLLKVARAMKSQTAPVSLGGPRCSIRAAEARLPSRAHAQPPAASFPPRGGRLAFHPQTCSVTLGKAPVLSQAWFSHLYSGGRRAQYLTTHRADPACSAQGLYHFEPQFPQLTNG